MRVGNRDRVPNLRRARHEILLNRYRSRSGIKSQLSFEKDSIEKVQKSIIDLGNNEKNNLNEKPLITLYK